MRRVEVAIKTVNLKVAIMPSVEEALQRLDREIAVARRQKHSLLKVVHGYGSTGEGGDIRIAVQKPVATNWLRPGRFADAFSGRTGRSPTKSAWRLLRAAA